MAGKTGDTIPISGNRYGVTLLIPLVFFAFYLWVVLYCFRPLGDPDIWWHLAAGRWMSGHGGAPRVDPFSFTALGTRWTDSYWLYEIVLYAILRMSGCAGIILFNSLLVAGGLFFQERLLAGRGLPWTLRLGALALTLAAAEPRGYGWTENASTVSFLFLSALFWLRDRRRSGRPAGLPVWIGFFALWANLHRGFLLGLAVLALDALEECRGRIWKKPGGLGLAALCGLATLANPYGIGVYRLAFLDARLSPIHTYNWAWSPFHRLEIFWALFAAFWTARAWKGAGGRVEWLAPLFLSWIAVRHAWGVRFFALYAASDLASGLWDRIKKAPAQALLHGGQPAVALPVLALLFWAIAAQPARALVAGSGVPAAACDFIAREKIRGPFYNDYGFGGYFIWRFAGKLPVFIDGRYPSVEGYMPLYGRLMKAKLGSPEDWRRFLDSYGVRAALVGYPPPQTPLERFAKYFPKSRWKLLYRDETALLFTRR